MHKKKPYSQLSYNGSEFKKSLHLLNSSLSFICVKETMVLVTEVPMFAPMIMGIAVFTGVPAATKPTMIDVEVEELWKLNL